MTSQSTSAVSGDATNVTKSTSSNTGDSCTWYAGENCSLPRTGYDCLNMLLETDECAIDPNGACVSMSVYRKYLSNREYDEPLSRYFSASNYTYCSTNDSICSTCITEWTTNYEMTGSAGSTRYCTGSDGCVCVAASEVPDWEQNVISRQCDGSSDSDSVSSPEFSSATQICIILGICFGAVMGFSVFAVRRWFRSAVSKSSGSAHYHPSGPQLSLTGWKSLREKLIETEHSFVNGGTTRLDATARSDESLSEAPSVIMEVSPAPRRSQSPPPVETQYTMAPM